MTKGQGPRHHRTPKSALMLQTCDKRACDPELYRSLSYRRKPRDFLHFPLGESMAAICPSSLVCGETRPAMDLIWPACGFGSARRLGRARQTSGATENVGCGLPSTRVHPSALRATGSSHNFHKKPNFFLSPAFTNCDQGFQISHPASNHRQGSSIPSARRHGWGDRPRIHPRSSQCLRASDATERWPRNGGGSTSRAGCAGRLAEEDHPNAPGGGGLR